MNHILINICENNKQGNPSGRCHQFCFQDENGFPFFLLECKFIEGVVIQELWNGYEQSGKIKMYNHFIEFQSVNSWVGNMAWNEYKTLPQYALGLINLLKRQRDFSVTESCSDLMDKYNSGEPITAADLGLEKNIFPVLLNPAQLLIL